VIVGFSKHGTGGGRGPTQYMTDEQRAGRENAPPVVLRGDAEQTRQLIDSLEFKHKYTSGVLSFAPDEKITPKMEQAIMDRFESVAFGGLEPDQYDILWVRHTHAGHHELHFVTPRVELSTGKSLNIKPPGERAREHFDDFRSEINARYGLADPTDPDRARNVSTPDHELKIASEALRSGQKPPDNMRELIDGVLSQRAVQGLMRSREDVLEHVKDLGLDVMRTGKDYITVSEPKSGQRWRLKGGLYARDYEPSRTIEKSDAARERDYSRPDPEAAQRYAQRVERHIAARAEYHQSRYPKPEPKHRLEHVQEPVLVADLGRPQSLSRHLRRELGNDALLHQPDHGATAQRPDLGAGRGQDPVQQLRQAPVRPDRRERDALSGRLQDFEGVLNDRVRNPLVERLEAFGAAIQGATASVRAGAKRLTNDVRAYFTREQELAPASQQLEQSGRQLERSAPAIRQAVQHEQALDQQRQREISRSRSGPSLGM
jgi:hypothetical protein